MPPRRLATDVSADLRRRSQPMQADGAEPFVRRGHSRITLFGLPGANVLAPKVTRALNIVRNGRGAVTTEHAS